MNFWRKKPPVIGRAALDIEYLEGAPFQRSGSVPAQYRRIPKVVRFVLIPVTTPLLIVLVLAAYIPLKIGVAIYDAWKEFE